MSEQAEQLQNQVVGGGGGGGGGGGDCMDIPEMKMSWAADVFDLSIHIKMIIEHNPKNLDFDIGVIWHWPMDSCRAVENLECGDDISRID